MLYKLSVLINIVDSDAVKFAEPFSCFAPNWCIKALYPVFDFGYFKRFLCSFFIPQVRPLAPNMFKLLSYDITKLTISFIILNKSLATACRSVFILLRSRAVVFI